MNIMDFVDSIKFQLSDLESVGELGYVKGISNIIIRNLKALDENMRPVHCSDLRREKIYIKDADKWEKTEPSFDTTIPATNNNPSGTSLNANEPLSHSYILFERQDEGTKDYRLSTAGSPGFKYTWQVVAFDGNGVQESNVAESQGNDPVGLEFTTFNASKIILVVSVLPGNDYNPEKSPKPSAHYRYELK
jgi:hypothetical protein